MRLGADYLKEKASQKNVLPRKNKVSLIATMSPGKCPISSSSTLPAHPHYPYRRGLGNSRAWKFGVNGFNLGACHCSHYVGRASPIELRYHQ